MRKAGAGCRCGDFWDAKTEADSAGPPSVPWWREQGATWSFCARASSSLPDVFNQFATPRINSFQQSNRNSFARSRSGRSESSHPGRRRQRLCSARSSARLEGMPSFRSFARYPATLPAFPLSRISRCRRDTGLAPAFHIVNSLGHTVALPAACETQDRTASIGSNT